MKSKTVICNVIASLLSASVFAGPMGSVASTAQNSWILSLSVGPVFENMSQSQNLYLTSNINNIYLVIQHRHLQMEKFS